MSGGEVFVSSALIATRTGRNRGVPPTQGHRFTDPRTGRTIDQKDRRIKLWRQLIRQQIIMSGWQQIIMSGPVACTLDFILPRPQEHYRSGKAQGLVRVLRDRVPLWHAKKPDIDTLSRAVLDGLTQCGAIGDDAQIALLVASKRYTSGGQVGVRICCEPMDATADYPQPAEKAAS